MKIVSKQPEKTADISSARGSAGRELWQLILWAGVFLVGLYFATGIAVDAIVARISFETEARLFKHLTPPISESTDPANRKHLDRAAAILDGMTSVHGVPPLPYQLALIENDMPNAFAFPGGRIGVTTGLMAALTEDIELAFVIGHELGHFHNRDHLEGMGRAMGFSAAMAILFGSGPGARSFGDMANFVYQRTYSQKREKKADQYGLALVHSVYGKTDGVDRLFMILLEEQKLPGWAYMFSTHPSPETRIQDLKRYAGVLAGTSKG